VIELCEHKGREKQRPIVPGERLSGRNVKSLAGIQGSEEAAGVQDEHEGFWSGLFPKSSNRLVHPLRERRIVAGEQRQPRTRRLGVPDQIPHRLPYELSLAPPRRQAPERGLEIIRQIDGRLLHAIHVTIRLNV
jgi:hypothetical protein